MERRGSRGNERRRSGMWIAAVYVSLLMLDLCAQPVACLSACHEPPQVIRISRGQKITVEYWVGQNALETGAGQQPWKPESTPSADVSTTGATSGDSNNSEDDVPEPIATTAVPLAEKAQPTLADSPLITEKIPRVLPSSSTYPPATATETTTATAKVNVTGTSSEPTLSPKTNSLTPDSEQRPLVVAAVTSVNDQNFDERVNEQESSSIRIDAGQSELNTVASRQSETSTPRHAPITDSSDHTEIEVINAEPEVTSSNNEVPDITLLAESELKEEVDSTSSFSSDFTTVQVDGRGHESRELSTEYSSPDYRHQESSALSSDDGLTEIAYWAVTTPEPSSEDDSNIIESRNAIKNGVTDANRTSTEASSDNEETTAALSSSNEHVSLTLRSANETTVDSTENVTDSSIGRAEKAVDELSSTIVPTELAVDSTEAITQSIIQQTGNISEATATNATFEIDDKIVQGRNDYNETLTTVYDQTTEQEIDSTTSFSIQREPEIIKGKSVLETISTTIRAIFSTLAPTTTQEELISGRNENATIIQNSEDLPATTAIHDSTTRIEETLENNSTVGKSNRGGDDLEESTNSQMILIEGRNQNSTDSSAIIFEEVSSSDPLMTIDPRDPKVTDEELTTIASGRVAPSATDAVTEGVESETLATVDEGATTTDVVIILDLDDDEDVGLTEKSTPQEKSKKEVAKSPTTNSVTNATTVTPVLQTNQQKEQDDEGGVTGLGAQPESSRPAEGARKFENTDVSINGEDSKREQGEESNFRSTVINRKRIRKPFVGRNRKPNFVRHRPPYVSLDPAGRRPPFFLRQAPSVGSNARPAYTVDESPMAADRADPPSRVVQMDSDDNLDNLDPLLEDASSDGSAYYAAAPYFESEMQQRADFLPPTESRVHYVSVMRPPDGVLPVRDLRMTYPNDKSKRRRVLLQNRNKRSLENATNDCQWIFRSDPGVPLLLTFKSFSTPETPDCKDHFISVERESNGFQSRWCGASGDRPGHAAFARSEINLQLFSVGDGSFPTGFSVEVQALDLKLLRKYAEVRRIIKGK